MSGEHETANDNPAIIHALQQIKERDESIYKKADDEFLSGKIEDLIDPNDTKNLRPRLIRHARKVYMDILAADIQEAFREGRAYDFDRCRTSVPEEIAQDSFFYQTLFLGYLRLIKELSGDRVELLHRSETTGQSVRGNEGKSKLKFDPFGGVFTTDPATRMKYFKYRVIFLKSLWALASRKKIKLFNLKKELA